MSVQVQRKRYYIGQEIDLPLLREGGMDIMRRYMPLKSHTNPGDEITYLLSGEVTWQVVDGPALHLSGGDISMMQSQVLHHGEFEIIQPCELLWFVIDPQATDAQRHTPFTTDDIAELQRTCEAAGNVTVHADERMKQLFLELQHVLFARDMQDDPWRNAILRTLIVQGILLTMQALREHAYVHESVEITRAKAYLERLITSPHAMKDVADHVGMSPSWFYERFKKEVGMTPADYQNRLRCAAARRVLAESQRSITEIAIELGFASSQYFATCFRKYTGMTPSAFRQQTTASKEPHETQIRPA